MKGFFIRTLVLISFAFVLGYCGDKQEGKVGGGMSSVEDESSQKDILRIAMGSKDHSTLVTAVTAAELQDTLANPGPFTVFAPVNAAFEKLPPGTVEGLLKPEKKGDLEDILYHHVIVGVINVEELEDGTDQNMFAGGSIKVTKKDGKVQVDGANILGSAKASNGLVYIIDGVLLPK